MYIVQNKINGIFDIETRLARLELVNLKDHDRNCTFRDRKAIEKLLSVNYRFDRIENNKKMSV